MLQSVGYMTRSMGSSGRQGSVKKSVEFDLSGTQRSSWRGSEDSLSMMAGNSDQMSNTGRSLGMTYSFRDSESERDFKRSGLKMSVTIPTDQAEGDSDISEIDITENTFD